jgi:hypothetical protein
MGLTLAIGRVSRNTLMRSSIKPSTCPVITGSVVNAMGLAVANGTLGPNRIGSGVTGWSGLQRVSGCHSAHMLILLARSVTNSEKQHMSEGLGILQR